MANLALHDVLEKIYGVKTYRRDNPLTATCATTVTKLLPGNPNRLSGTIINLGSSPIYLAPTNDVATTKGIYLASNGGFLSINFLEDFELVSEPWWGIASAANSTVYIIENISQGTGDRPE